MASRRVGRHPHGRAGERLPEKVADESRPGRTVGRSGRGQATRAALKRQAPRKLPHRLRAHSQRSRLGRRWDLAGDEDVMVAEYRIDGTDHADAVEVSDGATEDSRVARRVEVRPVIERVGVARELP